MTDETFTKCVGCPCHLKEGDVFFVVDVGKLTSECGVMLPMTEVQDTYNESSGMYCEACAVTKLDMASDDVIRAKLAVTAHCQRHGKD